MRIRRLGPALLLLTVVGCRSEVDELSSSHYMLGLLDRNWETARKAVEADPPDFASFRAIQANLSGRVLASVDDSYEGDNKQAVLTKLEAVTSAYKTRVLSLFDPNARVIRLRAGVTVAQFRQAFRETDKVYRELEALTEGA